MPAVGGGVEHSRGVADQGLDTSSAHRTAQHSTTAEFSTQPASHALGVLT